MTEPVTIVETPIHLDFSYTPGVASSRFSPGSKYLLLRMNRPAGAPATPAGADLVLHDEIGPAMNSAVPAN